jgi:hypothetical protein
MCSKQANGRSPATDVANPSGSLKGEACALSFGVNIAAAQTLSIHSATVCLPPLPALTSDADQVQGTDPGSGWRLPYQNEPVAEPPPLAPEMLQPYLRRLLHLLQPGETVIAGLRQVSSQRRWALCCALSLVECVRWLTNGACGAGPALMGPRGLLPLSAGGWLERVPCWTSLATRSRRAASFRRGCAAGMQVSCQRRLAAGTAAPGLYIKGWPGTCEAEGGVPSPPC